MSSQSCCKALYYAQYLCIIRGGLIPCWVAGPKLKIRQMPIRITFVPALSIFLRWKKSQALFYMRILWEDQKSRLGAEDQKSITW